MWLINVETFQLEGFMASPPPYGILSHTWTNEEVTFDEIQSQDPEASRRNERELEAGW
jgi:hypothetical protein